MSEGTLRIAQLNAGSLFEPGWDERREVLVAWLEHLAPDIICLQEVWRDGSGTDTAAWVVDALGGDGWYWRFGGYPFAPKLWPDQTLDFGSAILSRWPIDAHAHHRLPTVDGRDPMVDKVPWELLHVRTAGLDVFSTHLAAAPTHGLHRLRQVVAIDDHVREIRGALDDLAGFGVKREGMPAILCGDFNAEPDSDEIRFLCGLMPIGDRTTYWIDAWREAGTGPGHTSDPRTNPLASAMNVTTKRIDYVFVGDPFQRADGAGRVLSANLAFDASLTGRIASDHYGLSVDIAWPTRPTP